MTDLLVEERGSRRSRDDDTSEHVIDHRREEEGEREQIRCGDEDLLERFAVIALFDPLGDELHIEQGFGEEQRLDDRIATEGRDEDEQPNDERNRSLLDRDPERIELEQTDPAGEQHRDEADERDPIRLLADELVIDTVADRERDGDEQRDPRIERQVDEEQRRDDDVEGDVEERILVRAHPRGGQRTVYKHCNRLLLVWMST